MRLDHVIRTSHRKRDALSPSQQRHIAERSSHEIVTTHDSGRSESGKTMDRASLRAVRERVRAGETDGVFVSYLDRLGRAPIEESMTFVRELVGEGGVLVAADWSDEPIDLTDSNVEDMLVFRLQMNRSMWNKAAERQRINKRDSLEAGKFIGPTPFGYAKRDGRLIPDETWGPVLTQAFEIAARDGWDAVVTYLQATAPDERIWRTDMVRKMLANRTYLGEHAKRGTAGYRGHPPLTDPETFALAQHAPRARKMNGEYLLSNLVRCECGADLIGQDRGDRGRRYRCQLGHTTANADLLDAEVRESLRAALDNNAVRARVMPAGIDKAQARAEATARSYRSFLRAGDPEDVDFAEVAEERRRARDEAQAAYDALRAQTKAIEMLPGAEQLDDDAKVRTGLRILATRGLTLRLGVAGRPPRPLAERVRWHDLELDAGALAA
jgi:resolvase-like protein